jgi:hypothetical protein
MDKRPSPRLKLIPGENRLRGQVIECFFRGSCMGEDEAKERFEQLARRLNHRASLRLVDQASGEAPVSRSDDRDR